MGYSREMYVSGGRVQVTINSGVGWLLSLMNAGGDCPVLVFALFQIVINGGCLW